MRQDAPHRPGESFVAISCGNLNCEHLDVLLAFPVTVMKLEKVDACNCTT